MHSTCSAATPGAVHRAQEDRTQEDLGHGTPLASFAMLM